MHKGFEYARSAEPDALGLRALRRRPRKRHGRLRLRLRAGGDRHRARAARPRRPCRRHRTTSTAARFRLFERVRARSAGLAFTFVDLTDLAAVEAALRPETKLRLGRDADQSAAAALPTSRRSPALAQAPGAWLAADNTFASPYVQRPLELGFDLVVHSTTKYLNGHSDMVGGVAVVGARRRAARAAGLPAERRRRDLGPVRQLPGAARGEDAGAADGAALRQRARDRRMAGGAPARRAR